MDNNWIITSKIHISEDDYKKWLKSSAQFITNAELYNCDTADRFVNILLGGSIKAPYSSIEMFFANELSEMMLSFDKEVLILHYNKFSKTLDFAFEINRYNGFNMAAYNIAMLLSISSFKNNNISDVCILSDKSFNNASYAIEFTDKSAKIIKILTKDIVIPHRYRLVYDMLLGDEVLQTYLDKDVYELFTAMITKRLETDLEDIIMFSSPTQPAVITYDAKFKTDGKHVITDKGEIVNGADPAKFMSIGLGYGMDSNKIYYCTKEVTGADIDSFYVLNYGYAKDKNSAYYKGEKICSLNCNFRAFKQAEGYATDNTNIYYHGKVLENSDPMAFATVGDTSFYEAKFLVKDNVYTYLDGEVVDYIDSQTLTSIGKNFYKDKNCVYYIKTPLKDLNPNDVRVLNEYYIADKSKAYYCDKKSVQALENVNPLGLRVRSRLASDNVSVYFKGILIQGLNGAEVDIEYYNFCGYLQDKNSVFYYLDKVDANPATFKALDFGYGSDGNYLFFKDKKIREGNFQSVISLFDSSIAGTSHKIDINDIIELGGSFRKLKNKIYYSSFLIKDADAETFHTLTVDTPTGPIYTNYASDKNHVYYKDKILPEGNKDAFCILLHPDYDTIVDYIPGTAVDLKNVYYRGEIIPDIDPAVIRPFMIHRAWYAGNDIIYKGKVIKGIDLENFHKIEGDIYTDNKRIYYKILPAINIEPDKIVILSNNYIKDDNDLCYLEEDRHGNLTANSFSPHINSFDILPENNAFSFDRYKIYFKGLEVKDIDLGSLAMIGNNYINDKDHIYCGNVRLDNVDLGLFMLLGDGYATDGHHTFYQDKLLETKNMLHVLGQGYATDGVTFWLYGVVLDNPYEHQYITDILGQGFA